MKLSIKTKKILKIATISALALLEVYLIYASAASMYTYNQHPRFVAADGTVAQSSGYKTQFYLCLSFAVAIPILGTVLSYFFWLRKPKTVKAGEAEAVPGVAEAAATDDPDRYSEKLKPDIDAALDSLKLDGGDVTQKKA